MKMNKQIARVAAPIIITAALMAPYQAFAASQGSVGATSTGSVDIDLTVPQLARISALNDIALGTWTGTGGLSGSDSLCVWTTTGAYNVTATGSGAGGAFTLDDGSGGTLAYAVEWADTAAAGAGSAMTAGAALNGQNAAATSTTCNGGANLDATVLVDVIEADLAAASYGNYTGTLTLVVAPE